MPDDLATTHATGRMHADDAVLDRLASRALDLASDPIYWVRPDASVAWCNEAACRALGWPRDELLCRTIPDFDPGIDGERWTVFLEQCRTQGRVRFPTRHVRRDGTVFPVEISADRVLLEEREFFCAIARDLTEREDAEVRLLQQMAQLQERGRFIESVLNTSPDVIYVYDLAERRNLYISREFQRMMGYTSAEIAELGDDPLPRLLHPDDRIAYEQVVLPRYATLRDGEVFPLRYRFRHRDGTWRWIKAREVIHSRFPDGTPRQVFGLARDATPEREAEQRYRTILRTTTDGFWLADSAGRILDVNDAYCEMVGYTREELLTLSIADLEANEDPDETAAHVRHVFEVGHDRFETRARCKDGTALDVEISVHAIPQSGGRMAVFSRDISGRKKAERRLLRLSEELEGRTREMEQMIYVASHDLRSPLLNVQGFASILEHDVRVLRKELNGAWLPDATGALAEKVLGDVAPEALSFISKSVERMDTLLNGLLKVSRAGRSATEPRTVDMDRLLADVAAAQEFRVLTLGARLTIDPLPPCQGDPALLAQVFANLLDNALKYLDPARPGVVRVHGEADGPEVLYTVEDNGIGIAPSHADRVFELFHRLDPHRGEGEGIGLTIVRTIVERHGGRVWLESEAGVGSRFKVLLPGGETTQSTGRPP